jgi:hypothetical protein
MNPVKQPTRLFIKKRKVVLREDFMALTKDINQALVLSQMLYWTKKIDDLNDMILEENKRLAEHGQPQIEYFHGWIWKSARQMKDELFNSLSEDAIQRAFATLAEKGIFVKRRNPNFKYDRTLQYRIDLILLRRMLKDIGVDFTDFQLDSIPHCAESITQATVSTPCIAETIPEITIEITSKNNPLTPFQGEEESSAMASHSSVDKTQPNLFQTYPNEANASGSATAELKSADGKKKAPHSEAPPRTRKSRESKPVDEKFISELQRLNPDKDVEREIKAAQTWLLSRPDRKYTRGFLANWVIRSKNIINPDKFHNNNSF